jgi:hypothetical protein
MKKDKHDMAAKIAEAATKALKHLGAESVLIVTHGKYDGATHATGIMGSVEADLTTIAQIVCGIARYLTEGVRQASSPEQFQRYLDLVGNPATGVGSRCMEAMCGVVDRNTGCEHDTIEMLYKDDGTYSVPYANKTVH